MKNGGRRERFFEEIEGCLLLQSPHKWNVFASLFFCHSGQRRHHLRVISDKPSVEIGKPKEALDICNISWGFPTQDAGHLFQIHPDPLGCDDESQIFHFLLVKMTFLQLQVQSSLPQYFQHLIHLFLVLLQGIAVYEDVIEECRTEVIKVGTEHIVYKHLEIGCCIRQPEWYNQ